MWGNLAGSAMSGAAGSAATNALMPSVFGQMGGMAMPSMAGELASTAITDGVVGAGSEFLANGIGTMAGNAMAGNAMGIGMNGMAGAGLQSAMPSMMDMGGMALKGFGAYNDYKNKKTARNMMKNQDNRASEAWNRDKGAQDRRRALKF